MSSNSSGIDHNGPVGDSSGDAARDSSDEVKNEVESIGGGTVKTTAKHEDEARSAEPYVTGKKDGRRSSPAVWIAIALVATLAAIGLGVMAFMQNRAEDRRDQARDAAVEYTTAMATYSFDDLEGNKKKIMENSTDEFSSRYEETVGKLNELITKGEGSSTAKVPHAAVKEIDGETATVLVFLNQEVKNVVAPEGRVELSRMVVTLKWGDGRWLLDNAEVA